MCLRNKNQSTNLRQKGKSVCTTYQSWTYIRMANGCPKIKLSQTTILPALPLNTYLVKMFRGIWASMPLNDHKRKRCNGMLIKYSWKKADTIKTVQLA
uniref:Uncharacterized protein n=1 Tax=Romanomermis culicivorax TaxID=13658 RepID=A0A915JQJ6_ROMCU